MSTSRPARATSMLEVLATVAILAILAAAAIPHLSGLGQANADGQARATIAAALRAAETAAPAGGLDGGGVSALPATWPNNPVGTALPGHQIVPEIGWNDPGVESTDPQVVSAGVAKTADRVLGVAFAAAGGDGSCFYAWRPAAPAASGTAVTASTVYLFREAGIAKPCSAQPLISAAVAGTPAALVSSGRGSSYEFPQLITAASAP